MNKVFKYVGICVVIGFAAVALPGQESDPDARIGELEERIRRLEEAQKSGKANNF